MPASSAHARPGANGPRQGFTLIELIVVLLLMGLAFALVAPSLTRRPVPDIGATQRVLDAARSTAVRRGETMLLDVRADGRWAVTGGADTAPVLRGVIDPAPARAHRITISPLGACMYDPAGSATVDSGAWDPLRCTLREAGDTRARTP